MKRKMKGDMPTVKMIALDWLRRKSPQQVGQRGGCHLGHVMQSLETSWARLEMGRLLLGHAFFQVQYGIYVYHIS